MCVTGTISMAKPTANNNAVPLLMHPLSFEQRNKYTHTHTVYMQSYSFL